MSSSKLIQLRETLKQLEDYDLPEKYQTGTSDGLQEDVIARYREARNQYIQKRAQQVFYDHLGTWDGTSYEMPGLPTEEEQQQVRAKQQEMSKKLLDTASDLNHQMQMLQNNYTVFSTRREELAHMVQEMEEAELRGEASQEKDSGDVIEEDVDEEEMALAEERLANLRKKRSELEAELHSIRNETRQAQLSLKDSQESVKELRQARGVVDLLGDDTDGRVASPTSATDVHQLATVEQIVAKTTELQNRAKELREMSDWYDSMRTTVEELGGIKILSVQASPSTDGKTSENDLVLDIQLVGTHEIQVVLTSSGSADGRLKTEDELRLSSAKFLTDTLITSPNADVQDDKGAVVQMRIPALDDLVRLSANLGPLEDLRFLLRETLARIRTVKARVDELHLLRKRYLTKVSKSSSHFDYGFGGEDQEIVCSLNEGVTVVLRLTPDCPMVDGSVYIEQIVGVGGWDQEVLDRMKDTVNATTCRGPLSLMDELASEIKRLEKEEGVIVPRTPEMPGRRAM